MLNIIGYYYYWNWDLLQVTWYTSSYHDAIFLSSLKAKFKLTKVIMKQQSERDVQHTVRSWSLSQWEFTVGGATQHDLSLIGCVRKHPLHP